MNTALFDANAALYAWLTYRRYLFTNLWQWMEVPKIAMAKANFDEVLNEDIREWLTETSMIAIIPANSAIMQQVRVLEGHLGVKDGNYGQKGADLPDLIAVATAMVCGYDLVTQEKDQKPLPKGERKLKNYKIPAICAAFAPQVRVYSFGRWIDAHYPGETAPYEEPPYAIHEEEAVYKVEFRTHSSAMRF